MSTVGLVLEGGGMRGAYTAGVLQALYSEKIEFPYLVGVSAGALTATSFLSGQPRRNYDTFVTYAQDKRYMGLHQYMDTGNVFNFDFVLGRLVYELLPFDFDAFFKNPCRMRIGTTDIATGLPVFFEKSDLFGDRDLTVLRASSSLPLVSETVHYRGYNLLDGGLSSPIPVDRAVADGCDKCVVVLTRERNYHKKPEKYQRIIAKKYADYPKLLEVMRTRHEIYERQRKLAFELEKQGKAVVICPSLLNVGRYERRKEHLAALHDRGITDVAPLLPQIRALFD